MITVFDPVLVIRSVLEDPERDWGLESCFGGYLESRDEGYLELELDLSPVNLTLGQLLLISMYVLCRFISYMKVYVQKNCSCGKDLTKSYSSLNHAKTTTILNFQVRKRYFLGFFFSGLIILQCYIGQFVGPQIKIYLSNSPRKKKSK